MNTKTILDIIAYVVLIALGVYQLYKSGKRFKQHIDSRNDFLAINKEVLQEEFLEHKTWMLIYGAIGVVAFAFAIYFFVSVKDYLYGVALITLTIIMAGYVLDCFVTRRSWYYEDGFYFENKFYRYRSLANIAPKKSIFRIYEVRFHAHPDIAVTKKMGEKLQEKEAEWKKARKEKKKLERSNG